MKKCPFCAEEIQSDAVKCRFCGEFVDGRMPEQSVIIQAAPISEEQKKTETTALGGCLGFFILILLAGFLLSLCSGDDPVSTSTSSASKNTTDYSKSVTPKQDGVNIRKSPSANSEVINNLGTGADLIKVGERGTWTQVVWRPTPNDTGWVSSSLVEPYSNHQARVRRIERSREIVYARSDGSVSQIERYLRTNLKDPDSLDFIKWVGPVLTDNAWTVMVTYRAKNSFGGYVIESYMFIMDLDGRITDTVKLE